MNLILDQDELRKFISILPQLDEQERYLLSLFYRGKYVNPDIAHTTYLLGRKVCRKDKIEQSIREFEICTNYFYRGDPIPEHGLAVYITINPRCLIKATQMLAKECVDILIRQDNYKIDYISMSCIQKAKSKSKFFHLDIDGEFDLEHIRSIVDCIVVQTRGGCHILVPTTNMTQQVYNSLIKLPGIDRTKDMQLPVPGARTGDVTPRIL